MATKRRETDGYSQSWEAPDFAFWGPPIVPAGASSRRRGAAGSRRCFVTGSWRCACALFFVSVSIQMAL